MSLFFESKCFDGIVRKGEWHVGEPMPEIGRVVKFQADGQELDVILDALIKWSASKP